MRKSFPTSLVVCAMVTCVIGQTGIFDNGNNGSVVGNGIADNYQVEINRADTLTWKLGNYQAHFMIRQKNSPIALDILRLSRSIGLQWTDQADTIAARIQITNSPLSSPPGLKKSNGVGDSIIYRPALRMDGLNGRDLEYRGSRVVLDATSGQHIYLPDYQEADFLLVDSTYRLRKGDWSNVLNWSEESNVLTPNSTTDRIQIGAEAIPSNPDYMLSVDGKIIATEIEIEATPWPDYVFDDNHELLPLNELQAYITKYGHLPNIPSATDVEKEGIALGEMSARLLEKIEELTLYTLEQERQLQQEKARNDRQIDMINKLTSRIEKLENKAK